MGEGKGKKEVPELVHTQLVWPTSGSWIPAIFDFPFHTFHKFLFEPSQTSEHQDSHYCQPCKPATIACSHIGSKIRPVENLCPPIQVLVPPFSPRIPVPARTGGGIFLGLPDFIGTASRRTGTVILRGACAHCQSVRPQVSTSPTKRERERDSVFERQGK